MQASNLLGPLGRPGLASALGKCSWQVLLQVQFFLKKKFPVPTPQATGSRAEIIWQLCSVGTFTRLAGHRFPPLRPPVPTQKSYGNCVAWELSPALAYIILITIEDGVGRDQGEWAQACVLALYARCLPKACVPTTTITHPIAK